MSKPKPADMGFKTFLATVTLGLLLAGCSTIAGSRAPVGTAESLFPRPPLPLDEFLKHPVDGTYSLPRSATRAAHAGHDILVVSGGAARLTRLVEGRVSTAEWDFVEFRPMLPSEDMVQQFGPETTEADIERRLGKPTRMAYDKIPFLEIKSKDTRYAKYSWFTVAPPSALTSMSVSVEYTRGKDGRWTVKAVYWDKSGGHQLP